MSFECVNWAYQQDLKPGPKFVLVTLANVCNQDGLCYPSQRYLMRRTGFSERSVWAHLNALEAHDPPLIKRNHRTTAAGARTSDLCQLQVPWHVDQPAPGDGRAKPTRKICESYPQNVPNLPANSAGNTSEIHQGSVSGVRTAGSDHGRLFAEPKTRGRKRAVPLPADWQPDAETVCWATGEGLDGDTIGRELARFKDHGRSTGRALRDWDAGFRNWCRNAQDFNAERRGAGAGDGRGSDGILAVGARVAARGRD